MESRARFDWELRRGWSLTSIAAADCYCLTARHSPSVLSHKHTHTHTRSGFVDFSSVLSYQVLHFVALVFSVLSDTSADLTNITVSVIIESRMIFAAQNTCLICAVYVYDNCCTLGLNGWLVTHYIWSICGSLPAFHAILCLLFFLVVTDV